MTSPVPSCASMSVLIDSRVTLAYCVWNCSRADRASLCGGSAPRQRPPMA
eukprot:CAMPEP_0175890432 /NCGR_PEP_ID=MMETSP0107_2-20121207/47811_1 /TAXON_ID=195067 ORGANISM="Goniomonas pacifica, Strain CCMP1869" /NCGR_SAMPLE_ID=MMETSP0107_2 /ASSEMBLY_ACC=CAM_ASM_000203 /LENGTH=49 /DNA_ID=CAMNT_0017211169 /DNA_START=475 /DNA_END=624 /DNA_ORIENTATION=+